MATYNGEKYIKEQLDSIIPQIGPEDEIIISDDGSTDSTLQIIRSYKDPRIKILEFKREKSGIEPVKLVTTNFENALKESKGDIIFLSDQDDVWMPDKVKVSLYYLIDLGYDYIESSCYIVDQNLNNAKPSINERKHFNKWTSIFGWAPFRGCLSAFKRPVLETALPFPSNLQSHDRWIAWIACFKYKYFIGTPERLIKYRRYDGNVSTLHWKGGFGVFKQLFTRLTYSYFLLKRLVFCS